MITAPDVGTTYQAGPYTVRIALRHDNPAFAKYLIFRGDALVAKQFSRPSESDCRWLEQNEGLYAETSRAMELSLLTGIEWTIDEKRLRGGVSTKRRGRPRKEDARRQLEEALQS